MVVTKHYTLFLCCLAPQQDSQRLGGDCAFLTLFSGSAFRSLWGDCYMHSELCLSRVWNPICKGCQASTGMGALVMSKYWQSKKAQNKVISGWRGRSSCFPCSPSSDPELQVVAGKCVSLLQQQWQTAIQKMKKCFQKLPFCHITSPQGENLAAELENCANECFSSAPGLPLTCFHLRVNR